MNNEYDEKNSGLQGGVTRRGFLTSVGAGAVVAATAGKLSAETGTTTSCPLPWTFLKR
jgi:hypothetical protein